MASPDKTPDPAQPSRPRVTVLSLSRSIGMSHYTQGLAASLSAHSDVDVIDRANLGHQAFWAALRLRHHRRQCIPLIATSPHWTLPFILAWTRARGAHVMHGPLIYMANRLTRPIYVAYYRAITRSLRVVILHAERFVTNVRELRLHESRIIVVPHGFVPVQLIRRGEYDPAGPVICIGRLLPYKGVDVMVEALRILADRGMPTAAVIGGEGVDDSIAPQQGIHGLEILSGRISDAAFAAIIDRCCAVVLPYRNATQSGVLAHAFAAGRPVIATSVGSFPEYVDSSNGFLVPPNDAEALADAIAAIRNDPIGARTLASGARVTWEERLDPNAAARQIIEALGI